jgi:hypothetical protein
VSLSFSSTSTPLPGGETVFVMLSAKVPALSAYGGSHVLSLTDLVIVDTLDASVSASVDDAVHLAAYFGDSTGNGEYSGLDAQRVARVGVGLDGGFEVYPTTDPLVVADISRDGTISGLDAQRVALQAVGLAPEEIPQPQQPLRLDLTTTSSPSRQTLDVADPSSIVAPDSGEFGYMGYVTRTTIQTSGVGDDRRLSPTPEVFSVPSRFPRTPAERTILLRHAHVDKRDSLTDESEAEHFWDFYPPNPHAIDWVFGNTQW